MTSETRVDVLAVLRKHIKAERSLGYEASAREGEQALEAAASLIEQWRTLAKVISLAHVGKKRAPRWAHVSAITSHGSTLSASLCRQFDLDPDEIVGGLAPVTWSPLLRPASAEAKAGEA